MKDDHATLEKLTTILNTNSRTRKGAFHYDSLLTVSLTLCFMTIACTALAYIVGTPPVWAGYTLMILLLLSIFVFLLWVFIFFIDAVLYFRQLYLNLTKRVDRDRHHIHRSAADVRSKYSLQSLQTLKRDIDLEIRVRSRTGQLVAIVAAIGAGILALAPSLTLAPMAIDAINQMVPAFLLGSAIGAALIHRHVTRLMRIEHMIGEAEDLRQ
ncbi:hypothetical protein FKB34_14525 [Glycocaulis profundi]|nr:hypothetical protein FKB34_14525 [Glycocaulis profundi]